MFGCTVVVEIFIDFPPSNRIVLFAKFFVAWSQLRDPLPGAKRPFADPFGGPAAKFAKGGAQAAGWRYICSFPLTKLGNCFLDFVANPNDDHKEGSRYFIFISQGGL